MRKRKIVGLFMTVMMLISLCPVINVQARALTSDELYKKFQELQALYPENSLWTGTYNNLSWECMGWADTVCDYIFGENPRLWTPQYNLNNMAVGDQARINNNGHSIVITNVVGDTVYYADCNWNMDARVHWNKSMSRSELQSKLTWIKSQPDNWVRTLSSTPVAPVSMAIHTDTNQHVRNGYFTFRNSSSGKMMQVYDGVDKDTQQIDMWSFDDSIAQRFNVQHKGGGKYKLYAECSDGGNNRVVDIFRNGGSIEAGQLVDLWTPNDDTAQLFYIWPVNNNEYVFEIAAKEGYVICPKDASAANQDGYKKGSQLVVQKYTGAAYQKWKLCNNNGKETTPNISYAPGAYKVDTDGDPLNVRSGSGTGNSLVGSVPHGAVLSVTEVNNNWGKMSYNGVNGWVCLDFTVYTVVLDSISIASKPKKTSYYAGDTFNSDGLQIVAKYSNGQTETLTSGFTVNCDVSSAGIKTATVSYSGKSTTFDVNVQSVSVNDIALYSTDITKEYHVGDNVKSSEIKILVNYSNGQGSILSNGFDLSYDFSSPGTKTVTISYGGKTTSYEVEVLQNAAQDSAVLSVSSVICDEGDSAIVYVSLNSENVCDGNMTIQYDNTKLELVDAAAYGELAQRQVTINKSYDADKVRVTFAGTSVLDSGDAPILKLTFKALSSGNAQITIAESRMYDTKGQTVSVSSGNGSVSIGAAVDNVQVSNIQSVAVNGKNTVTADVSNDNVNCYLAGYKNGILTECDIAQPQSGRVELSVNSGCDYMKLMVWSNSMKPLMNVRTLY